VNFGPLFHFILNGHGPHWYALNGTPYGVSGRIMMGAYIIYTSCNSYAMLCLFTVLVSNLRCFFKFCMK